MWRLWWCVVEGLHVFKLSEDGLKGGNNARHELVCELGTSGFLARLVPWEDVLCP